MKQHIVNITDELSSFTRILSIDTSAIFCTKKISFSESEEALRKLNKSDVVINLFSSCRKEQMTRRIQEWEKEPRHSQPWNAINQYYKGITYTPIIYLQWLSRLYISQQLSIALQMLQECPKSDTQHITQSAKSFLTDMMQLGYVLRQLSYTLIPDNIAGKYCTDKMKTLVADKPIEHSYPISLFLAGLSFSVEAITSYANLAQQHSEFADANVSIQTQVSQYIANELRDVDASMIQITTSRSKTKMAADARHDTADVIQRIHTYIQPLCLNEQLTALWDKILHTPELASELATYRAKVINRQLGFNVNKLYAIITLMNELHLLPFREKKEILEALKTKGNSIPASYLNPSAINKLQYQKILKDICNNTIPKPTPSR